MGKRLGFSDKAGKIVWQAVRSIKAMQPGVFYMENVVTIQDESDNCQGACPLDDIVENLTGELPNYPMSLVRNLTPYATVGVPNNKPRVAICGCRADLMPEPVLAQCFGKLLDMPLRLTCDFREFIGRTTTIDLRRVGQVPTAEEQLRILKSACQCTFDPDVDCPRHPCKCEICKRGSAGKCAWRATHKRWIQQNLTSTAMQLKDIIARANTVMSYTQVVDPQSDHLPSSQRERNLINVYAMLAKCQPLDRTMTVVDKAHSMPRNGLRCDGIVNTMVTNASVFSFRDADSLNVAEVAKLMGYEMNSLAITALSQTQFRHMLGMCVHKGISGLLLIGLLAALGGPVRG